jgi:hypothetical protein
MMDDGPNRKLWWKRWGTRARRDRGTDSANVQLKGKARAFLANTAAEKFHTRD